MNPELLNHEHPHLSGPELLQLFEVLPEAGQAAIWERIKIRSADRRFVAGHGPLLTYKKPKSRPAVKRGNVATGKSSSRPQDDPLTTIPAAIYLEAFGADIWPNGQMRCVRPDHEDTHPSATYSDTVWYCHRCAVGGGIYQAAAELTGLHDRGDSFRELKRWVANRLAVNP